MARKKAPLTVEAAVENDLKALGDCLAGSALAASALALARELDKSQNSATSKAMCARAMREAMDRLRELVPPQEDKDWLDELTASAGAGSTAT